MPPQGGRGGRVFKKCALNCGRGLLYAVVQPDHEACDPFTTAEIIARMPDRCHRSRWPLVLNSQHAKARLPSYLCKLPVVHQTGGQRPCGASVVAASWARGTTRRPVSHGSSKSCESPDQNIAPRRFCFSNQPTT